MSFKAPINLIVDRFKTEVADNVAGLLVQYPNDRTFDKPEGERWARVEVLPGKSGQVSLGENKRFRNPGLLVVSVFVPGGEGTNLAYDIADLIDDETAFRNVTVGGVKYMKPSVSVVGRTVSNEWQLNIDCPFYFDEIES